jgi:hypothetical protein
MRFFIVFSTYDHIGERSVTFYRCVKECESQDDAEQWAKAVIPQAIQLGDDDEAWAGGTEITVRPLDHWVGELLLRATALEEHGEEDHD